MLYHACSYTHFCRMPYLCCSQWDAHCCLPPIRDPATGRLMRITNLTLPGHSSPLPQRIPAQQLRQLMSMWNMWYFWFMLIFLLFVCFGVCGVHKRRSAAWAAAYRGASTTAAGATGRRSGLLLMDWAPRLPRFTPTGGRTALAESRGRIARRHFDDDNDGDIVYHDDEGQLGGSNNRDFMVTMDATVPQARCYTSPPPLPPPASVPAASNACNNYTPPPYQPKADATTVPASLHQTQQVGPPPPAYRAVESPGSGGGGSGNSNTCHRGAADVVGRDAGATAEPQQQRQQEAEEEVEEDQNLPPPPYRLQER